MEMNKFIIGGIAAAAVVVTASVAAVMVTREKEEVPKPKYRRVDVAAFKRSMTERYKHVELVEVTADVRAVLVKSIHTNIDKDINNLFGDAEQSELVEHNEKLFSKYTS